MVVVVVVVSDDAGHGILVVAAQAPVEVVPASGTGWFRPNTGGMYSSGVHVHV
jgi:hypothetical protein